LKDDLCGGVLILAGRDHQVVEVNVAPAFAEVLLQVFGALAIHDTDALLDIGALFEPLAQAQDAIAQRRIDKERIERRGRR
jgi:hypothetical protein